MPFLLLFVVFLRKTHCKRSGVSCPLRCSVFWYIITWNRVISGDFRLISYFLFPVYIHFCRHPEQDQADQKHNRKRAHTYIGPPGELA